MAWPGRTNVVPGATHGTAAKEVSAMLIDTRTMGFTLTDAILRHVEARVESALGPLAQWVLKVTMRLEDVNAERGYSENRAYGNAKLANILFTAELHNRFFDRGISTAAFHPGIVATNFADGSTSLMRLVYRSVFKIFLISPDDIQTNGVEISPVPTAPAASPWSLMGRRLAFFMGTQTNPADVVHLNPLLSRYPTTSPRLFTSFKVVSHQGPKPHFAISTGSPSALQSNATVKWHPVIAGHPA